MAKGPLKITIKICNPCNWYDIGLKEGYFVCLCRHPDVKEKYIQDDRHGYVETRDWCPYERHRNFKEVQNES